MEKGNTKWLSYYSFLQYKKTIIVITGKKKLLSYI